MDKFDKVKRSEIMRSVPGKNTKPEMIVRKLLHRLGFRYRLHRSDLPGKPDIVLSKYNTIIFIHGCFWHRHEGCARSKMPVTNRNFWEEKIAKNVERDKRVINQLTVLGWRVLIIWECETRKKMMGQLANKIETYLKTN